MWMAPSKHTPADAQWVLRHFLPLYSEALQPVGVIEAWRGWRNPLLSGPRPLDRGVGLMLYRDRTRWSVAVFGTYKRCWVSLIGYGTVATSVQKH